MDLAALLCLPGSAGTPSPWRPAGCAPLPAARNARSGRPRACDARRTRAYQTGWARAPLGVETFDLARLPRALVAGRVLPFCKEARIGAQVVGVDRFVPVARGHVRPDQLEHRIRAVLSRKRDIADHEADHLPDLTRHGGPQPQAGRHPDAEFLDLDHVILGRGHTRDAVLLELGFYSGCVFLRMARMLWRPTWSVRAMPRWKCAPAAPGRSAAPSGA